MFQISCCCSLSPLHSNIILASAAGLFFFSGWWIMISLLVEKVAETIHFLPGFFATMALAIINLFPAGVIYQPHLYASSNRCAPFMVQFCLFIGFMALFGSLIAAIYILFHDYILNKSVADKWPGFGVFLESFLVFVACVLLRCRKDLSY